MPRGGLLIAFAGEKFSFFEPLDPCLYDFAEYIDGDRSSGRV